MVLRNPFAASGAILAACLAFAPSAMAADITPTPQSEDGLVSSKTLTGTGTPNRYELNLSATGRDYANKRHALFVLDRTGSLTQPVYDEIAGMTRDLGKRLMATGQVDVSVVLFAGWASDPDSPYHDGWDKVVANSTIPSDMDNIMVPVSVSPKAIEQYGPEGSTNWQAAFRGASHDMQNESDMTDIFFFSDGHPNYWYGGTPHDQREGVAYDYALDEAKKFSHDYDSKIEAFTAFGLQRDGQNLDVLSSLSSSAFGDKGSTIFASTGNDISSGLQTGVEKNLMTGYANDVTFDDTLSGNIRPVSLDGRNRPMLSVSISENGKAATPLTEGKDYTYAYQNNHLTVKLIAPLKGSQKATVTIPVEPSDTASKQALEGQAGPDVGDPDTGSLSAGKHGWYSNTGSNTVTHRNPITGDTGKSLLPNPVMPITIAHVNYQPNGGKGTMPSKTGLIGDKPSVSGNAFTPADECKEFAGWNTQADGKGVSYKADDHISPLKADVVLYAQWHAKKNCPAVAQTVRQQPQTPAKLAQTGTAIGAGLAAVAVLAGAGISLAFLKRRRA